MNALLPLLLSLTAAPSPAQVVRAVVPAVPAVAAAGPAALAPLSPSPALGLPLAAPSLRASAPLPGAAPAAAAAPEAVAEDREAALVGTLAAKLPGSDCVTRRKTASWIGELAAEHPREAVQTAAARGLIADASSANDLIYFSHATGLVESFAAATPHDAVFATAVSALIEAARASGRAQSLEAVSSVVRLSRGAGAARRAKAAAALESLRGTPAFRGDDETLERAIAAARG
jgi:hypothetical protein